MFKENMTFQNSNNSVRRMFSYLSYYGMAWKKIKFHIFGWLYRREEHVSCEGDRREEHLSREGYRREGHVSREGDRMEEHVSREGNTCYEHIKLVSLQPPSQD